MSVSLRQQAPTKKQVLLTLLLAFTAGLALSVPIASASANSWSDLGYYTVNGKQYVNRAFMWIPYPSQHPGPAIAQTETGPSSGSVASGWAGSRGRLFTESGALSCEGANTYNGSSMTYPSRVTGDSCTRVQSAVWYSYGVSQGWTGSSYQPFYTFRSPNQNS